MSLVMLLAFAATTAPAQAGTDFTVNSDGDAADANPGDGFCATAGAVCTLRAAMEESNAVGGDFVIGFAPSVTGQILLTSPLPQMVISHMTIVGLGADQLAIDGANTYRVFESQFATQATISGLTIRHGRGTSGGGIQVGGGIATGGDTTLNRVVVTQNTANGITDSYGGGISVGAGTLTLRNSTVTENNATVTATGATDGHAYGAGIAVFAGASLVVDHSAVVQNTASVTGGSDAGAHGGGIYNQGPVEIRQSTISGNTATASGAVDSQFVTGGGLYEDNNGMLTTTGSTFSDNAVSQSGSGLFFSADGANVALVPTPDATAQSSIIANPNGATTAFPTAPLWSPPASTSTRTEAAASTRRLT